MIELPEANVLAGQITAAAAGKEIVRAEAGRSPHRFAFFFGEPAGYSCLLEGKRLLEARANGGQVEIFFDGGVRLVLNDGVNIRYLAPAAARPKKCQLLLDFSDGGSFVCTVQMYGGLLAFLDGENDSFYYLAGKEKPSPLSEAFDEAYFRGLLETSKPGLSVKAFLATEQRIPGLGNGVLQDLLFFAGVNPRSRLSALTEEDLRRLYRSVKETLPRMARAGGRNTEKDLFGNAGGYPTQMCRAALTRPCPHCGGTAVREAYLGGNVYYCPVCQPLKK